jgi:hypothetical protein
MVAPANRSSSELRNAEERELREALERAQAEFQKGSDSDGQLTGTGFLKALKVFSKFVMR